MEQSDDVVHDHAERLAARLGIAMRHLHRDLLMRGHQHRRLVVGVVHQRIVQAAIGRTGIEHDIGKAELLDQIGDDVGLPTGIRRQPCPQLPPSLRSMRMAVARPMRMLMVMAVIVIGDGDLTFGIAEHQGFDGAPQRVLMQRHMGGDETGQPRKHPMAPSQCV